MRRRVAPVQCIGDAGALVAAQQVTIAEAAEALGVSRDTIRRRLKSGDLTGEQRSTAQGFTWYVDLPAPDETPAATQNGTNASAATEGGVSDAIELARLQARIDGLERLVEEVKQDRDAWRGAFTSLDERRDKELAELREALMQAQAITMSLPARMAIAEQSEPTDVAHQAPASTSEVEAVADPEPPVGFLSRLWRALGGS